MYRLLWFNEHCKQTHCKSENENLVVTNISFYTYVEIQRLKNRFKPISVKLTPIKIKLVLIKKDSTVILKFLTRLKR